MKLSNWLRLGAAFAFVCLALSARAQYTTVSASYLGGSLSPAPSAMIYWQPTGVARVGASNGQILGIPLTAPVTNGVFSLSVPDSGSTNPNICYAVTAIDPVGTVLLGAGLASDRIHVNTGGAYGCLQPIGSTWNFDLYLPTSSAVVPPLVGGTVTGPMTFNAPVSFASTASFGSVQATTVAATTVTGNLVQGGPPGTVLGTYTIDPQPLQQAVDASGNVWIASAPNKTVTALTPTGAVLHHYTMAIAPDCAVVDNAGFVWLCNQSVNSVSKINPATGAVIGTYTTGASPDNMAIDLKGNVWIATSGTSSVTELSSSGAVLGNWSTGSGAPWNVAIDSGGNCWTGNWTSGTMSKISPTGALLGVFTVGTHPQVFGIDAAGNVWVPNEDSYTVTKLSPLGATLLTVPISDSGLGGLAIDGDGNIWVYGVNYVTELNSSGQVLNTIAAPAHSAFESVDRQGNLWITSYANATITKIATGTKGVLTPMVATLSPDVLSLLATGNTFTTEQNIFVTTPSGTASTTPVGLSVFDTATLGSASGQDENLGGFTGYAGTLTQALNVHITRETAGSTNTTAGIGISCDLGTTVAGCGSLYFYNGQLQSSVPIAAPGLGAPFYNAAGTIITTPHAVIGSIQLSGGAATVTFSGAAAFTGLTYYCTLAQYYGTAGDAIKITEVSGTSFTLAGVGTDAFYYHCIGN